MLAYNWDLENCPLYRVAGCPLFRGYLSIEVNVRTVGTFRYIMGVHFSGVSVKRDYTVYLIIAHSLSAHMQRPACRTLSIFPKYITKPTFKVMNKFFIRQKTVKL